jgi:hypothetical protein
MYEVLKFEVVPMNIRNFLYKQLISSRAKRLKLNHMKGGVSAEMGANVHLVRFFAKFSTNISGHLIIVVVEVYKG